MEIGASFEIPGLRCVFGCSSVPLLRSVALGIPQADYNLECTCFKGHPQCDPSDPGRNCRAPDGIGRNAYNANVTAHDMRETYLAGWKAASAAGVQGAMCSSNAVNGIPVSDVGDTSPQPTPR